MTPRVSLIVPVYNVADHVADCLYSIASQTFADFEAIIIDDGSTDGSGDIAQDTVSGDGRFIIRRTENAGLSAARNTGLSLATADLLGFIDSDDRIAPDYLKKLIDALETSKADWVSCGIEFHKAGEKPVTHSAMHGMGEMEVDAEPTHHSLEDWCDVIQHFPSVWNKIYRRKILGDIRFDEGLNYEDHAFFWRYAARTDHLLRLSEPLYLSTQGREGQITRDGSDRVFQQFEVLDILESVATQSEKSGRQTALARIATRLSFERADAIQDGQRRQKFLGAARNWLGKRQLQPEPKLGVPAYWEEALNGLLPLSVVVPTNGDLSTLKPTLDSLAAQTLREIEVLVVPDETCCPANTDNRKGVFSCASQYPRTSVIACGHGLSSARNRGLELAQGQTIVFLDSGDSLAPKALAAWHNRLRKVDADVGLAKLRMGNAQSPHSGWHDVLLMPQKGSDDEVVFEPKGDDILGIHGHPSAKIFDRRLLEKTGGFPDAHSDAFGHPFRSHPATCSEVFGHL